jgi:hypothetical protein
MRGELSSGQYHSFSQIDRGKWDCTSLHRVGGGGRLMVRLRSKDLRFDTPIRWSKLRILWTEANVLNIGEKVAVKPPFWKAMDLFTNVLDQWLKTKGTLILIPTGERNCLCIGFCSRLSSEHMLHLWAHQPFQSTSVQQQGPNSITKFGSWKGTFSASILPFVYGGYCWKGYLSAEK